MSGFGSSLVLHVIAKQQFAARFQVSTVGEGEILHHKVGSRGAKHCEHSRAGLFGSHVAPVAVAHHHVAYHYVILVVSLCVVGHCHRYSRQYSRVTLYGLVLKRHYHHRVFVAAHLVEPYRMSVGSGVRQGGGIRRLGEWQLYVELHSHHVRIVGHIYGHTRHLACRCCQLAYGQRALRRCHKAEHRA